MRRFALIFAVLAGCTSTEPEAEINIQVEGTVTAAADGVAVTGATVAVGQAGWDSGTLLRRATSDPDGRYSLSFVETGYCSERLFWIQATCGGFQTQSFGGFSDDSTRVFCTEEPQIIHFELEPSWNVAYLTDLWGTSQGDVYAVGIDGAIGRYDGAEWNAMLSRASDNLTFGCGTGARLFGVWGISSSDIYAVGDSGIILHYDGNGWSTMTRATTQTILDVWGTSSSDIYSVVVDGSILHYDGTAWSRASSGATPVGLTRPSSMNCVWGTSPTDVFAVGEFGTILHYDGASWTVMTSGIETTPHLFGLWGTSPTNIFAVGGWGTILHYDGSEWSPMAGGSDIYFSAVWGASSSDVFAVGAGGILHFDGTSWSQMATDTNGGLIAVWGTSSSDVYAVGSSAILHYDGTGWTTMTR